MDAMPSIILKNLLETALADFFGYRKLYKSTAGQQHLPVALVRLNVIVLDSMLNQATLFHRTVTTVS
jgi:predicted choloylglycine hydrolase